MEFPDITVSVGADTGGSNDDTFATERMRGLCTVFQVDPTQQLAYKTIVSEVMRNRLMWHTGDDLGDPEVPVPVWWTTS